MSQLDSLVLSSAPGQWPLTDDEGRALTVVHNPLRGIPRTRNKLLITKPGLSGRGPIVLSGAVPAILEHVLFTSDGYLPYASPPELLKMMTEAIEARLKADGGRLSRPVSKRVYKFIYEWLGTYGARDFKKKALATQALNFCTAHFPPGEANKLKLLYIKVQVTVRIFVLTAKLVRKNSVQVEVSKLPVPVNNAVPMTNFILEDLSPELIANYLTFIEFSLYQAMKPWEFLNQAWQRDDKLTKAPHLSALIGRFNQVSSWVASQIVQAQVTRGVRVITHFIDVAKRLFDMNNYNTLLEILSGLNNANISRLRPLWAEVPLKDKETFERLDETMAPQANFKLYRETLRTKRTLGEFTFPYLAVHLRDLTFVNDANPDFTPNKFLNFEKLSLQGLTILELMSYKNPSLPLVCEDSALLQWLRQMKGLSEDEIREHSLRMVPLKSISDSDTSVPVHLSSSLHQQWGPSGLIRTVEVRQLSSWTLEDIDAWLSKNSSRAACDCLMKQVRSGPQLLHLTEENLVSLGVPKESLSPLLAALKQLREQNPDMRIALSSLLEREPRVWSVLDVAQWLIAIGLGTLRQIFIFHLVDGKGLFQLTDSLLVDMQVRDPVHRARLLKKIALLKERRPSGLNDDDESSSGLEASGTRSSTGGSSASNTSDSSDADKAIVMVYYEDTKVELRLVPSEYKKFKRTVRKNFGGARLRIKFQDKEGQLCQMKSDNDLALAMEPARDGHINIYLFAKRRKRLTYTGAARSDSPVAFLRQASAGTVRIRSRSGSATALSASAFARERTTSASSLTDNSTPSSTGRDPEATSDASTKSSTSVPHQLSSDNL